jgi:K+-sensing histidine kinase KdpD
MSPAEAFSTSIFFNSTPRQYAAAVGATLFALLIAAAMMPVAAGYTVYLVLPAAVAFSAVYCGLGPSVVAIAVALFGVRYWFINPSRSLSIPDGPQSIGILAFVVVSGVVVAIGERNRANIEALRQSLGNLEERIGERTAELDIANQGLGGLTRSFAIADGSAVESLASCTTALGSPSWLWPESV